MQSFLKLAAGDFAAARAREEGEKILLEERQKSAAAISEIKSAASSEALRVLQEKELLAQQVFEEQQRTTALELHSQNLKADLARLEQEELARRDSIIAKGFRAAKREYWACRWLAVLLFGLGSWIISANVFEFSQSLNIALTIFASSFGYWFVPNMLEPAVNSVADKRFTSFVGQFDSNIDCTKVIKNYRGGTWLKNPE